MSAAPFIDPPAVVEACESLNATFYRLAAEYEADGNLSEAARLRREADAHMAFAEHFRPKSTEQDEAA